MRVFIRHLSLAVAGFLILAASRPLWAATPNDPGFGSQWGLYNTGQTLNGATGTAGYDIGAIKAWNTITNASTVVVAVIDSGVDYEHPDLAANMWRNTGEIPNNGIDDDSNGIIDDYYGAAFTATSSSGDPMPDGEAHGTMVAGIIGAVGNNSVGVSGVAWNVQIMALKVADFDDAPLRAVDYILKMKARGVNVRVVCASFGGEGSRGDGMDAKIKALGEAGIIWVGAAGNDSIDNDASMFKEYPASYDSPFIVSVAAMNASAEMADFSHWGWRSVDVAAPGANINSTALNDSYDMDDGTSFATPMTAGVLALLAARYPDDTVYERLSRLLSTVNADAAFTGKVATGGYVNATRALSSTAALKPFLANATTQEGMVYGKAFTLQGVHFGSAQGGVAFGNLTSNAPNGTVTSWSATSVTGVVPPDAGRYVMVADADGNLSNALEFTAWRSVANMSVSHADGAAAAWAGKLYVAGGLVSESASTTAFEVYDPRSDTWGNLTAMPASRAWCSAVAVNKTIRVFGGVTLPSGTFHSKMATYDVASNTWNSTGIGLPYLNATAAAVVGVDHILILGGMDSTGTAVSEIYKYDLGNGTLTQVGNLQTARYGHKAVAVGDNVLVYGGWASPAVPAGTLETVDKSYQSAANATPVMVVEEGAVTNGEELILATGAELHTPTNQTMEPFYYTYDPSKAVWSNCSGTTLLPTRPRAGAAAAFMPGHGMYAAGGFLEGAGESPSFLTTVDFLSMAQAVTPDVGDISAPTNATFVAITDSEPVERTSAQLASDYAGVPGGLEKFADAITFTAVVSPAGSLVAFGYAITAPSSVAAGSLSLYKFDDVANSSRTFSYAASATEVGDGAWWMEDANGTFMASSALLNANETYYVNFAIQDNGAFDLNSTLGGIRDPQAVMAPASGSGSSSSGCMANPTASLSWEWLMLAATPFCLALKRKTKA